MDIRNSVEDLVSELQQAVADGRTYIDGLQEKMDELEQAKDSLETYVEEADAALQALEAFSAGDFDDALEEAANLVD
jgi:phage shock protein A